MTQGPMSQPQVFNTITPQCRSCKHFKGDSQQPARCTAYPDLPGIPVEIWVNSVSHKTSYPGDHGVVYEKKEE